MRKKKSIWLLASASMMMLGCTLADIGPEVGTKQIERPTIAKNASGTGFDKYIGYGYNPARGIPLIDTANALRLNNPILDVNNAEMWANVNVKDDIDSSRQDSVSFTSTSAQQTAEKIGSSISGGISGKVKMVTVSLDSKFDINRNNITKVQEMFSYYSSVIRRRSVVLQTSEIQLRNYLNPSFVKEAKAIDSDLAANDFITKYGSHLLSGYTLGGVLEATNYFASSSSTAAVETGFDLKTEISLAMKSAQAGTHVSFSTEYAHKYDEATTTNHYHFNAFGGDDFPNITIDDLFAYKGGELSENKNLMYSIWTDSLNQDKNLAIVEVPDGSRMIGVWELLPDTSEFKAAKPHLINAYVTQCANAVRDANYSDLVQKISLPQTDDPSISLNGYEEYRDLSNNHGRVLVNYIKRSNSDTSTIVTRPGNIIAFDFNTGDFKDKELEWSLSLGGKNYAELLDSRNGIIKIKDNSLTSKKTFSVSVQCNGTNVYGPISIEINPEMIFSGGNGSESSPYLIANNDDYLALLKNESGANFNSDQHYRLINDLDLKNVAELKPLGDGTYPFKGTFDGDGHKITNFSLDKSNVLGGLNDHYSGFFGIVDGGKIKNLTLENPSFTAKLDSGDKDTPAAQLVAAGSMVGYAKLGSEIENCKVINPSIDIDRGDHFYRSGVLYDASEFFVGGAIGRNEGKITSFTVSGGSVKGKIGVGGNRLCAVGGLIGVNGFESLTSVAPQLSNISIENVKVYSQLREAANWLDYRDTYAGGMIGLAMDVDLLNANVFIQVDSCVESNNGNVAGDTFAGGLFGYLEDQTNQKSTLNNIAVLAGQNCLKNVGARNNYTGFISGGIKDVNKLFLDGDGVKVNTGTNAWKAFGNVDSNPSEKYVASQNVKAVKIPDSYSNDDIQINIDNAKTEFVVGDSFSAGEIKVTVNGTSVNSYWIDYSAFNSQNAGRYLIKVSYADVEESYEVYVRSAPIASISVALSNPYLTRYKDEQICLSDFTFKAIHTNGTEETLDPDAPNVNILLNNKAGNRLIEGSNRIGFVATVNGKEYSSDLSTMNQVIVNAKGRDFQSISWIGEAPRFEAYTNTILSASNVLKGSSFKVEYSAGERIEYQFVTNNSLKETAYRSNGSACDSVQMTRDEANIEVVVPSLSMGENEGIVCYDDYQTLLFVIVGSQDPNDHTNELATLRGLVDAIPSSKTLIERFKAIKAAKDYLDSLAAWDSAERQELVTTLNSYINSYNTAASAINEDIVESVEISAGINRFSLGRHGASIIAIILGILFAL